VRPDMSKVIVERPRRGSRLRNRKSALALDPRRIEDDRYIDPPKPRYSDSKSLNENLAPLRRFLASNTGRPWSKVYAEIRANLDGRKATGLHVLQHLPGLVEVDTWLDGKTVMVWERRGADRSQPVRGLYVHPVSGLLLRAPNRRERRRPKPVTERQIDADTVYRLTDGVWYRFEYALRGPNEIAEVVRFHEDQPERNREYGLASPGDRRVIRYRDLPPHRARYLLRRRQCTRQEIADI
jgi:hypothetical protein